MAAVCKLYRRVETGAGKLRGDKCIVNDNLILFVDIKKTVFIHSSSYLYIFVSTDRLYDIEALLCLYDRLGFYKWNE